MKHESILVVDEQGIELLVGYDYELTTGDFPDEELLYTEITSVEILVKGGPAIDIMLGLNDRQMQHINNLITQNHFV